MRLVRVGSAALNQTPLDWDSNASNILNAIKEAQEKEVGLLCLPELCITGYGCEDAFFAPETRRMARQILWELLPHTKGIATTFGLPIMHNSLLFNACAFVVDGQVVGIVPKQQLAGNGLHYEPRWFKAWQEGSTDVLQLENQTIPFGDLVFQLGDIRLGFEICEDAWASQRPAAHLANRDVDLILNTSASHFSFSKHKTRKQLVTESSRAFGVGYAYSNLVGNEAGRAVYDGGTLIAANGKLLAAGPRFGFTPHQITHAVLDIDDIRTSKAQLASRQYTPDTKDGIINVDFEVPQAIAESNPLNEAAWEHDAYLHEEEFSRAIALGLYDYARKSRSQGFIVSLSGGADSTAVTCLVYLMIDFALKHKSAEELCKELGIDQPAVLADSPATAITKHILTTAYQATQNSSDATRLAAKTVADCIGSTHYEFDIDPIVKQYTTMIEGGIKRELNWEKDDIALQNIQARVRAPGVWMLANIENKLLLATSNRSEAAVGYATMDGDTCGGISPIAGINKAFLRNWLVWLEKHGPHDVGPIDAVKAVNQLTPTAELRPAEQHQTDEDDLMPYEILDAIENEAIGRKKAPKETLAALLPQYPEYDQLLPPWIARFYTLWCRNQWKRERYAPSFHVDDKNLDPKTWCRFPILSGGYKREIEELLAVVTN
ncbi:NAD(+) synthase [Poriferisphaera sp. WC338]|uniref:NAD(+) synthase n=1 Tax=Poriferisphaera sp. WC338 TaxID=3425129 RepID=UPI003D815B3D